MTRYKPGNFQKISEKIDRFLRILVSFMLWDHPAINLQLLHMFQNYAVSVAIVSICIF